MGGYAGRTLAAHHVPRDDLVAAVTEAAVAVIEAAGGYGKTSLSMELASRDHRTLIVPLPPAASPGDLVAGAVRAARLRAEAERGERLLGLGESSDPLDALIELLASEVTGSTLIVDDIEHATVETGRLLSMLARTPIAPHRLILIGRALPDGCDDLGRVPGLRHFTSDDLRLTREQAGGLLRRGFGLEVPDDAVEAAHCATEGWAAGLVMWANRLRAGGDLDLADIRSDDVLSIVVERLREPLDDHDRWAAAQLAHLPGFDAALAERLGGPDLLRRLAGAGIAFTTVGPGEQRIAGPLAGRIGGWASLDRTIAVESADGYAAAGRAAVGVRLLADAGAHDDAAALLLRLPDDDLDPTELLALLETLPAGVRQRYPYLAIREARALYEIRRWPQWKAVLDRLDGHPERSRAPALKRAADAERAVELVVLQARRSEAEQLARDVLQELDREGEHALPTRLAAIDALGRALAFGDHNDSFAGARLVFEDGIELSREAGNTRWRFRLTMVLAKMVLFPLGRAADLLAAYDELLPLTSANTHLRAGLQLYRAEAMLDLGRYAELEEAFSEAERIAARSHDNYLLATINWGRAIAASQCGRTDDVLHYQAEAERLLPADIGPRHVALFYRDRVEEFLRVGELDIARRSLEVIESIESIEGEPRAYVEQAIAFFSAVAGDPLEAIAKIDDLQRRHPLPRDEWRRHLFRAAALQRLGDRRAGAEAATAFDLATRLGGASLPETREPGLTRKLAPLAAAAGSVAAVRQERQAAASIRCLGGFSVQVNGAEISVVGYSRDLVHALVALGGSAPAEVLIEHLWPGASAEQGRRALRNALHRLPSRDVLVERSGERLAIGPDVDVDALRFEAAARAAREALRADGQRALPTAVETIASYRRPFLPDTRVDVAEQTRRSLAHLAGALCDDASRAADDLGRPDEAVALLRQGVAIDPESEDRRVRLARLLQAVDRPLDAHLVLDEIDRLAAELDVRPSVEAIELRQSLRQIVLAS